MGRANLEGMISTGLSLRATLSWHLTSNHYPPVPTSMIDPCIAAINAINDGEHQRMIALPDGISYKGSSSAPAAAIAEAHHLAAFIEEN